MTPAELLLGVVLTGTQSHYEHRGVIDDKRLEHLLLAGKQILYKSHQESDVRCVDDDNRACCEDGAIYSSLSAGGTTKPRTLQTAVMHRPVLRGRPNG